MEHLSQILCNAFHTILMRVYHCRFAERVSIQLCRCMDNAFRMLKKVVVCRNAVLVIIDSVKQVVVSSQRLLLAVFLENDEVTAHFRIGIFREQVVGKTNR